MKYIELFLKEQKRLKKRGRCLHFEAGHRCNKIINAHSVQKSLIITNIADNGHIYTFNSNIGSLKKNSGKIVVNKIGVKKVFTFLGFCKLHDNKLFEEIDNFPLQPTNKQVFLYAYRSLCRELFVKENSLVHLEKQIEFFKNSNQKNNKKKLNLLKIYKRGAFKGFNDLKYHKKLYDNSFKDRRYEDIRYVIFTSKKKPTILFSGLKYPDYDYLGRRLQDLSNTIKRLELITFCSAPMLSGWGIVFAWHRSSSKICIPYLKSLATSMQNKKLSNLLFRLVISNCENLAISPEWWNNLTKEKRNQILARINAIYLPTLSTYLTKGLEDISGWEFEYVIDKMH